MVALRHCPRIKSLLVSDDFKPGFLALARMRCKQWDCAYCGIRNASQWRAHLLQTLTHEMPEKRWVFVTLTAPPYSHRNPLLSLKIMKTAWGKMYDKLRYANGGALSYVMVYETHKSGAWHIHALVDMGDVYDKADVPVPDFLTGKVRVRAEKKHKFCVWLKQKAVDAKAGWVCHATRIKEGPTSLDNCRLAVGYITKYFTKGIGEMLMPKRWRHLGTSRDIGSPKTKSKKLFKWWVKQFVVGENEAGIPYFILGENRLLRAADFGDDGIYPGDAEND